jgi:hypothetical protein
VVKILPVTGGFIGKKFAVMIIFPFVAHYSIKEKYFKEVDFFEAYDGLSSHSSLFFKFKVEKSFFLYYYFSRKIFFSIDKRKIFYIMSIVFRRWRKLGSLKSE